MFASNFSAFMWNTARLPALDFSFVELIEIRQNLWYATRFNAPWIQSPFSSHTSQKTQLWLLQAIISWSWRLYPSWLSEGYLQNTVALDICSSISKSRQGTFLVLGDNRAQTKILLLDSFGSRSPRKTDKWKRDSNSFSYIHRFIDLLSYFNALYPWWQAAAAASLVQQEDPPRIWAVLPKVRGAR